MGRALIEIEVAEDVATEAAPAQKTETSPPKEEAKKVERTQLSPDVEQSNHKALATPAVRSIAKKNGIDISKV